MISVLAIIVCIIVLMPIGLAAFGGAVLMLDEITATRSTDRQESGTA